MSTIHLFVRGVFSHTVQNFSVLNCCIASLYINLVHSILVKSCIMHSMAEDLQDVSLMERIEGGDLIVFQKPKYSKFK